MNSVADWVLVIAFGLVVLFAVVGGLVIAQFRKRDRQ
jgi:hypothetical protein